MLGLLIRYILFFRFLLLGQWGRISDLIQNVLHISRIRLCIVANYLRLLLVNFEL